MKVYILSQHFDYDDRENVGVYRTAGSALLNAVQQLGEMVGPSDSTWFVVDEWKVGGKAERWWSLYRLRVEAMKDAKHARGKVVATMDDGSVIVESRGGTEAKEG